MHAAQFTYGAVVANNLTGLNGQALASSDQVEIGTYRNDIFTSLHNGANDNQGVGPGFFSHANVAKQDTTAIDGYQLAIRWSHAASGTSAILYLDITTAGLDATLKDHWTVKSGDGGGNDRNSNFIDIANLTNGSAGGYNALIAGAKLVNASFAGNNSFNYPSFQIIPEPSTYAAFAGLLALAGTIIYRRR